MIKFFWFGVGIVGIVIGLPFLMRFNDESAPFALAKAGECPLVVEALGQPLSWSFLGLFYGSSEATGARATAAWRTSISGSKGQGVYKYNYDRRLADTKFSATLITEHRMFYLPDCVEISNLAQRDPDEVVKSVIKGEIAATGRDDLAIGTHCEAEIFVARPDEQSFLILVCDKNTIYNGKGEFKVTKSAAGEEVTFVDSLSESVDGSPKLAIRGLTGMDHLKGGTLRVEFEAAPDSAVLIHW